MRKNAPRLAYDGPWYGLNELESASTLPPGYLRACSNIEIFGSKIRPRRGFWQLSPTTPSKIVSAFAIPAEGGGREDDVLLQSFGGSGKDFYRLNRLGGTDSVVKLTGGTVPSTWQWNFNAASRACYAAAGGWTLVAASKQSMRLPTVLRLDLTNSKIYWTDYVLGTLNRCNLTGTSIETLLTGLKSPVGLSLDVTGDRVFIAEKGAGRVVQCALDGTGLTTLWDTSDGLEQPEGVAIHVGESLLFITDAAKRKLFVGADDGTGTLDTLLDAASSALIEHPSNVQVDETNDEVYFADRVLGQCIKYDDIATGGTATSVGFAPGAYDLALDVAGNVKYLVGRTRDLVRRTTLAGATQTTILDFDDANELQGIAVDVANSHLYWLQHRPYPQIRRATIATPILPQNITTLAEQTPVMAYARINGQDYWRRAGLERPPLSVGQGGMKAWARNNVDGAADASTTSDIGNIGDVIGYKVAFYSSISGLESDASDEVEMVSTAPLASGKLSGFLAWHPPPTAHGHLGGVPTDLFADRVRIYRRRISPNIESDWSFVTELDIDAGAVETASANEAAANLITLQATGRTHASNDLIGMTLEIVASGSSGIPVGQRRVVASNTTASPPVVTMTANWKDASNMDANVTNDTQYRILGSFADEAAVEELETTRLAPFNHGVPPPAAFVCKHRAITYYVPAKSRTIWYSEAGEQTEFRTGDEYVTDQNFDTLPEGGDITGVISFGELLLFFTEDGCWLGNDSDLANAGLQLYKLEGVEGCSSYWSIAKAVRKKKDVALYYAGDGGIMRYTGGGGSQCLSDNVPTQWESIQEGDWENDSNWADAQGLWDPHHRRYILAVSNTADTNPNFRALVWHEDGGQIVPWTFPFGLTGGCLARDDAAEMVVIWGGNGGEILEASRPKSKVYSDGKVSGGSNGTAIDWSLTTPRFALGDLTQEKDVLDLNVLWRFESGATLNLDVYLDDSGTTLGQKSYTLSSYPDTPYYVGAVARHVSFKASGTVSASSPKQLTLIGFSVNWKDRGKRG